MKAQSNNYRLLKLLTGHEKFQEYIKEVRHFLNIDENGFINSKKHREWVGDIDTKDSEYLNSVEHKRHNRNIVGKIKRDEIDRDMAQKQVRLLDDKLRINYLTSASQYVVRKFNLPSHLTVSIRDYILTNEINFTPVNNFAHIPDLKNEKVIRVQIYSRLTKKEEKSLLNLIKQETKNLPKIKAISDVMAEKLEFEDWYKNKDKHSEKMVAKDTLEEHSKSKKIHRVYDAKRDVADKRKKTFG